MDHPLTSPANFTQTPLGRPIPESRHAVSVSLPLWEHVIGYEEKNPAVMAHLSSGYPRFVIHPLVQELARSINPDQFCLPLPSLKAAQLAADFVQQASGQTVRMVSNYGVHGIVTQGPGTV